MNAVRTKNILLILIFTFVSFAFCLASYARAVASDIKKVVVIIAHEDFRDEEFLRPKGILEKKGVEVRVASSHLSEAKGMLGARVKPDIIISDIDINEYDAIILIGGKGASEYWHSRTVHKIINDADNAHKLLAAICIAPVTFANAGILAGKKATVWQPLAQVLLDKGARYTGEDLEQDGNIITADGPMAAEKFGQAIVEKLISQTANR